MACEGSWSPVFGQDAALRLQPPGELGAIRLSIGSKGRPVAHDFSRPVRGAGDHGRAAGIVSMRASANASATEGRTSRLPE